MPTGKRRRFNSTRSPRARQSGFGFLLALFAIAALGLLAASAGQVWETTARREKEAELLFIGNQYRHALASYHAVDVNGQHQFPAHLEDLLEDRRLPVVRRHLRRLYRDPMTGARDWVLVKVGETITALHSRSDKKAFKTYFTDEDAPFTGHPQYNEWVFVPSDEEKPQ